LKTSPTNPSRISWAEISLDRLRHNLDIIRRRIPATTDIIAVVKANAYGHGVEIITKELVRNGVTAFAVATLQEAIDLRAWAPTQSILVFEGCQHEEEDLFKDYRLMASVFDYRDNLEGIPVHVKIDTGMTRLGIPWTEARSFLENCPWDIRAVFSHFASADVDPGFSNLQLKRFLDVTSNFDYPRHLSNSAGLALPGTSLDAVRIGLALYGLSPGPKIGDLKPVLTWKTRVISLKEVPAGQAVGYGGTLVTGRRSRIAVVPTGYADGYNRILSNCGQVRIRGKLAPLAGRVSMDMTTIDVTEVPGVETGDEVTLVDGWPDSPLSACNLAAEMQTIPYEVLTSIGTRVERVPADGER